MSEPRLANRGTIVRSIYSGRNMCVLGPAMAKGKVWCTWMSHGLLCGGEFDGKSLIVVHAGSEKPPNRWLDHSQ